VRALSAFHKQQTSVENATVILRLPMQARVRCECMWHVKILCRQQKLDSHLATQSSLISSLAHLCHAPENRRYEQSRPLAARLLQLRLQWLCRIAPCAALRTIRRD
jgi:hypothetical protein